MQRSSTSYDHDHQLRARLQAYSPDEPGVVFPFSARLARENGWTRAEALRVMEEYRRFVYLAMTAGHPVTPSVAVDQAWHLHLTYTRSYWDDLCGRVLGRPLHHGPTTGGVAEASKFNDYYSRTLDSYRDAFGQEPPADVWPPASQRFAPTARIRQVSDATHWVVAKPSLWRRTDAAPLAVLLIVAGCAGAEGGEVGWLIVLLVLLCVAWEHDRRSRVAAAGPRKRHAQLRRNGSAPADGGDWATRWAIRVGIQGKETAAEAMAAAAAAADADAEAEAGEHRQARRSVTSLSPARSRCTLLADSPPLAPELPMHAILVPIALLTFALAATPAEAQRSRPVPDVRQVVQQVATAQATYRAAHGRYTASLRELGIERTRSVDVRIIAEGARGFSVVAIGADEECAAFHGTARSPRNYARTAARVACRSRRGGS
jgi:hypothetical protein